ncbi:NAD-dependent epimerase/dehydratase family protein [Nocardia crassostreae]|uniref:NAD-dependent epimerase/dehydratase family protein n=1 Tax=Nocardia crassostreae TaxID=53428 RepID=UPI000833FE9E|nr:NAD-dependent epimerase/dehydratase family protein [Nocardia crassostreae]
MSLHVVIGAGPVGTATATQLADRGERVRLLTRRGTGPQHPGIELIAADATDAPTLIGHSDGATALYQCAGIPYQRWATDFPPLAASCVSAAEKTGALLASVGNLYGYGPFDGPVGESQPLRPDSVKGRVRTDMWTTALAAHEAGRIRTVEVRGSDYLGAGANSTFTAMALSALLAGKQALVPADLDAPHSWTAIDDVARTLVAAAADETAWGRAWHVPTPPPMSMRALAELTATAAGTAPARIGRMPYAVLWVAGLFNADAREIRELRYQFDRPFVLDSTAATAHFGIEPIPTEQAVDAMVRAARG